MPKKIIERNSEEPVDLWPDDIAPANVTPPASIMNAQAALLSKRTKYGLRGVVGTTNLRGSLRHTFYIVAPALEDYRYELFEISHGVMPYPVHIISAPKDVGSQDLESEEEFLEWLRAVLSSGETKRVIGGLLAQVQG